MKKSRAYWKRFWHLMFHLVRLKEIHQGYTLGVSAFLFGKRIYRKVKTIGCTCGKVFFKEEK